jgi:coproporphyrinogen III oxidase-like Fe-S oxidoreductase
VADKNAVALVVSNRGYEMKKGIYIYRKEMCHNKCPYCGCSNRIEDERRICWQCGKEFIPVFTAEGSPASEKARGRLKARLKNWGK